jgi:glutamate synthase domain-containing protein 2
MTSEHDRALREMEPPNKIVQKSSGRYGISPEANEKVKKLGGSISLSALSCSDVML